MTFFFGGGVFLVTNIAGRLCNLWDKYDSKRYGQKVNIFYYMKEYRLKKSRNYMAFSFS